MRISDSSHCSDISIYRNDQYQHVIDKLLRGALDGVDIQQNIGDGSTYLDQLSTLHQLAKQNHAESIELLQNLALGVGEIADYAQNALCQIVCREAGSEYAAAAAVRAGCQSLIADFDRLITLETLQTRPKLAFVASTRIADDGENLDAIPPPVKEKVQALSQLQRIPKWFTPENGVFRGVSFETIKNEDALVRYHLPQDGTCQFRAAFILRDKNAWWLNAKKQDILAEIKARKIDQEIKAAIVNAVAQLNHAGMVPSQLASFFTRENFALIIYNNTIDNARFTLYCAQGIGAAIYEYIAQQRMQSGQGKERARITPRQDEDVVLMFLDLMADSIGTLLYQQLAMAENSHQHYFAEHTGNHYNIIAAA